MGRTKGRDAEQTREAILHAAEELVLADGVACLTLEKAADRAGLSKGGVLYHFRTRNELVTAMVERMSERFERGLQARRAEQPDGGYARAYVEECLGPNPDDREERIGAALIAAVAAEGDLLHPLQDGFARWQRELETDSADPVTATVARLAADGLWLCELFGIAALTPALREQVADRLRQLTTEAG